VFAGDLEFVEIHVQAAREDRSIDDIVLELTERERRRSQEGNKSCKRVEDEISAIPTKMKEASGASHQSL
jgi:hypothetical protein